VTYSQWCSEPDQVLIILHAINTPCTHEIYFNLCYLSLTVYFRDCADVVIMQTIDRVQECGRYLKVLMNDAVIMSRILSENMKENSDDGVKRLGISRERNINL